MIEPRSQVKTKLEELKAEFAELDVRDRLESLLEFSDTLPELPPEYQARRDAGENRVHECQTPVYMWVELPEGRLQIVADVPRDSPTVRGFVALLIEVLSGAPAAEVLAIKPTLLRELGLLEALGMVRMRGLHAILARIKAEVVRATGEQTTGEPEA